MLPKAIKDNVLRILSKVFALDILHSAYSISNVLILKQCPGYNAPQLLGLSIGAVYLATIGSFLNIFKRTTNEHFHISLTNGLLTVDSAIKANDIDFDSFDWLIKSYLASSVYDFLDKARKTIIESKEIDYSQVSEWHNEVLAVYRRLKFSNKCPRNIDKIIAHNSSQFYRFIEELQIHNEYVKDLDIKFSQQISSFSTGVENLYSINQIGKFNSILSDMDSYKNKINDLHKTYNMGGLSVKNGF